jgi:hypothetical protein
VGTPFAQLQALPKNGEPVVSKSWHSQDEAFTDVAKGIRLVAEKIKREREKLRQQEEAERLQRQREQQKAKNYDKKMKITCGFMNNKKPRSDDNTNK